MNPNKGQDQTMFECVVGSHIWGMDTSESDIDSSECYIINTRDFLINGKPKKDKFKSNVLDENGNRIDKQRYEISKVIELLKQSNPNMLWLVLSPIIQKEWKNSLKELRQITINNLTKKVYYGIEGMCRNNIRDFIMRGDPKSLKYKKKLNKIGRVLQFGITLLLYNKPVFEPKYVKDRNELNDLMIQLKQSFAVTTLPEKVDSKPFDDYLLKWRLRKLQVDELI